MISSRQTKNKRGTFFSVTWNHKDDTVVGCVCVCLSKWMDTIHWHARHSFHSIYKIANWTLSLIVAAIHRCKWQHSYTLLSLISRHLMKRNLEFLILLANSFFVCHTINSPFIFVDDMRLIYCYLYVLHSISTCSENEIRAKN